MKLTTRSIGCALLTLAVTQAVNAQDQSAPKIAADAIYTGGDIVTVNELQPQAEAIAVKDGRILAVGYRDEVMKLKGEQTRITDLAGRTLVPGFIDPHGHVFNTGIQAISANLLPRPDGGVNNIPELQAALKAWTEQNLKLTDSYGWIVGFGYDDAQLKEQRHPTRDDLDQVSTELPVVIVHQSGHLGVMNSKALEILGLNADTKNPPGGVIRRKQGTQEPDGVLEENAFFAQLFGLMSKLSPDANKALFSAGVSLYKSFGYTTAQEGKGSLDSVATMEAVAKSGKLDIDVVAYPDITVGVDAMKAPWLSRSYSDHFRIGGIKLTLDGSPQGKTAWLTKPYFKVPAGQPADYHGYSAFTDQQVNGFVEQAFKNNWQILAHVNGDAAIDQYINAVRAAEKKYGMADRRPVAIHAQTARLDQVEQFKALGIIPSFFPMHTFYWGDWHRDSVLGADRATNISPTGWAIERNMIVVDTGNSINKVDRPNAPPTAPLAPTASLCQPLDERPDGKLFMVLKATSMALAMALLAASLTMAPHFFGSMPKPFSSGVPSTSLILATRPGFSSSALAWRRSPMSADESGMLWSSGWLFTSK